MKHVSKIAYFLFLVTFGNISFGMMRFARQNMPVKSSSLQRIAKTRYFTEAPKTTPFYLRIKQAIGNAWAYVTNEFSQTPAITTPQSMGLHQSKRPFSISITPPMVKQMDQPELQKSHNIAQEINPILKAIERSKEQQGTPARKETALMVCTPPGIEIDFMRDLQSFDAIKNFIKTQKIRILTEAGLNNEEISHILLQVDKDQKYIYENAYTVPSKPVIHDMTLDPNILQEIKIKLKQAGINPLCVNIINRPQKEMIGFAGAMIPIRIKEQLFGDPTLIFSQELINATTRETVTFAIGHEIGHLILCHRNTFHWIKKYATEILREKKGVTEFEMQRFDPINNKMVEKDEDFLSIEMEKIVNDTLKEIKTLLELEADITYSLYDKNVAENSLKSTQAEISSGAFDTASMASDIHQSTNMRYHWLKRINDLHTAQEKVKE